MRGGQVTTRDPSTALGITGLRFAFFLVYILASMIGLGIR